jgi:hypothetical protein
MLGCRIKSYTKTSQFTYAFTKANEIKRWFWQCIEMWRGKKCIRLLNNLSRMTRVKGASNRALAQSNIKAVSINNDMTQHVEQWHDIV